MKKLNIYDQLNAAALLLVSPEWGKVKAARKSAVLFETPDVTMPTETRKIAGAISALLKLGQPMHRSWYYSARSQKVF